MLPSCVSLQGFLCIVVGLVLLLVMLYSASLFDNAEALGDYTDVSDGNLLSTPSIVSGVLLGRHSDAVFREMQRMQEDELPPHPVSGNATAGIYHSKVSTGAPKLNTTRLTAQTVWCPPREGDGSNQAFACNKTDGIYAALSTFAASKTALETRAKLDGYTVLISTYDRDYYAEECALYYATCPFVKQIKLVFHNPLREPPPNLVSLQDRIGTNGTTWPTFRLARADTNRISNRFNVSGITTDAVFTIDDDRKAPCSYLTEAFLLWLHMGELAFVIPLYDATRWLDLQPSHTDYDWKSPYADGKYNTGFVTQGGMMHRMMFESYFSDRYTTLRRLVDSSVTGEDMLMSLVHAESGGPVVAMTKWADRKNFMLEQQNKGSLSSRTAFMRSDILKAFRQSRPAVACATCTWWDARLQLPTSDPPHVTQTASGISDVTFRFNDSAFYIKVSLPPTPVTTNAPTPASWRSCQELSDLFGIAHMKSWGTATEAERNEWIMQRCKTRPST